MKRLLTTLSSAVLLGAVIVAQAPATRPSISTERLARIDPALQKYVDDNRIAGAVALVLQDGKPIYERAVGWSDKEAGRKMTTDTIFRIASQTKALTSAAILVLMEEGKLGVTDPVSRFIAPFASTTVAEPNGESNNARGPRQASDPDSRSVDAHGGHFLRHRPPHCGAVRGEGPWSRSRHGWYTADKSEPICETMERLATLPFVSHPGERYVYGYNTDVLGCVVERASGMPLDQFIKTRITDPLGMKDTGFFLPASERHRLAAVYSSDNDGRATRAPDGPRGQGHYVEGPRRSFSGGAGLLSTAHDYARFLEMIRNRGALGSVRILSPRTVALMTTNQSGTLHSATGLGYGYGFETTDRFGANGLDSEGAFGWGGAYGTVYRVDPKSRTVIVLMIQLIPNRTDIRTTFPTLMYQALVD